MMFDRVVIIVLDGVGIGALPDAPPTLIRVRQPCSMWLRLSVV